MPTDPYKCPCAECREVRRRSIAEAVLADPALTGIEKSQILNGLRALKAMRDDEPNTNHDPGDEDVTR